MAAGDVLGGRMQPLETPPLSSAKTGNNARQCHTFMDSVHALRRGTCEEKTLDALSCSILKSTD